MHTGNASHLAERFPKLSERTSVIFWKRVPTAFLTHPSPRQLGVVHTNTASETHDDQGGAMNTYNLQMATAGWEWCTRFTSANSAERIVTMMVISVLCGGSLWQRSNNEPSTHPLFKTDFSGHFQDRWFDCLSVQCDGSHGRVPITISPFQDRFQDVF